MTNKRIVENIICAIGDDVTRLGLEDTPNRVVKMWGEIFKGYDATKKPKITVFDNNADGIAYDEIIFDSGYFYSFCEHHMIPFFGRYYFGYIPDKKIVGLSKIARTVEYFASKLQTQERLSSEIVGYLQSKLKAEGMILVLEARHLCKEMRGVKMYGGIMKTSKVIGSFKKEHELETKFFQLMSGDKL
jgi:GTP cyclohydrolase I|tara:strand:+ start:11484 stop:12047 length:564 start_codon:yes stop_codon:yes gene_type:complete